MKTLMKPRPASFNEFWIRINSKHAKKVDKETLVWMLQHHALWHDFNVTKKLRQKQELKIFENSLKNKTLED